MPGGRVAFWQVDAFSTVPWGGNPAGVCVLDRPAPPAWMQSVAAEVNAAETAFVYPDPGAGGEGHGGWALRWFTPAAEVALCGHATLATAHVLWSEGRADAPLAFSTRSGVLRATRDGRSITLDFPAVPATAGPAPDDLLAALGVPLRWSGKNATNWLVEVADAATVAGLAPDIAAIGKLDAQGVIVTAAGGEGSDFVSRYFAPGVGVPEDPVTGSAHCTLAPYWAPRLGRVAMLGHQVSARGGWVGVRLEADRVHLSGSAVTVITGMLRGW